MTSPGSPEPDPRTIKFLYGRALYTDFSAAIMSKNPNELISGPPGAENLSTITASCFVLSGSSKTVMAPVEALAATVAFGK
mgnify:CR=1 FL=1